MGVLNGQRAQLGPGDCVVRCAVCQLQTLCAHLDFPEAEGLHVVFELPN